MIILTNRCGKTFHKKSAPPKKKEKKLHHIHLSPPQKFYSKLMINSILKKNNNTNIQIICRFILHLVKKKGKMSAFKHEFKNKNLASLAKEKKINKKYPTSIYFGYKKKKQPVRLCVLVPVSLRSHWPVSWRMTEP